MINVFQPSLGEEELDAIRQVFNSNWIGKGNMVSNFEEDFSKHLNCQSTQLVSTTSGSQPLLIAPYLFGFQPGDEIIAPALSFLTIGTSILNSGAKLILCDVDKYSCNTTADYIEEKITPRTKAIIINHYSGVPCDMDQILEICHSNNIIVIEDSACAIKSFYKGQACGTFGDMGTWSFGPTKIICIGDGGMIYFKSKDLVSKAKEKLYHGLPVKKTSGTDSALSGKNAWWEIQINRYGERAILNNISGAIGVSQLKKLDCFINRRQQIHKIYMSELSNLNWLELPPPLDEDVTSSYYFFTVFLERRDELARFLLDNDIYSTFRYWPLNKIKYFELTDVYLENTEYITNNMLNLPMHSNLSDEDLNTIINKVRKFGEKS